MGMRANRNQGVGLIDLGGRSEKPDENVKLCASQEASHRTEEIGL